ncbi:MAG TPA: glycoside hydrolase family 9 protein, partial [Bacteroidales bacterium]|nr:glycoside hydrolase family 9 protein [Bacteroidales bacterium]
MIMKRFYTTLAAVGAIILLTTYCSDDQSGKKMLVNNKQYLEKPGLTVLAFHDYYPSGHQGGIEIIQHGERIASNGFIRMQAVNGKRIPDPLTAVREIDSVKNLIKATVNYDDFGFKYSVRIWPEGNNIRLAVDLDKPLPEEWKGKLAFDLEFFPPLYAGKSWQLGESFGYISKQTLGQKYKDEDGNYRPVPMGSGRIFTLAGEDPERKVVIESPETDLVLTDNRSTGYGNWISVKSIIPADVTENAIEWTITPNVIPGWTREPVISVSQVGYHPAQTKKAIIELDRWTRKSGKASLVKIGEGGESREVLSASPADWGSFLAYNYSVFDFSSVTEPGMYMVIYGKTRSYPFAIKKDIFSSGVWQPTLEAYFPVQMCHVKVKDRSQIWHGACHLDDALQAPTDWQHVDQYHQYPAKDTKYDVQTPIPYLNVGGWHDAGDDDLAAGSQASTTHYLVLAYELSKNQTDQTYVNFEDKYVEMYKPDGVSDFQQQIKQGALSLLSGYRAAGHSFHGIIANKEGRNQTGDWASQTDQLFYDPKLKPNQKTMTHSGVNDDRWAFTNRDTGLEYKVAAALAAASRALAGFDDKLAKECIETARKAWEYEQTHDPVLTPAEYVPRDTKVQEILATSELFYTTGEEKYAAHLKALLPEIEKSAPRGVWSVARVADKIKDDAFNKGIRSALEAYKPKLDSTLASTPFGVPWRPAVWGVGWNIQEFAMQHYFLVKKYPDLFDREPVLNVVNYVLGCHPGSSTSLVSGVGPRSILIAFGVNRTMEGYIPGGMVSGTALIRPDFPELKENTPYLWQQTEYVMPGAATYIFCVMAADLLLGN